MKIEISKNEIVFKKIFKTKRYNFDDLNYYFERIESARFKTYKVVFLVKNNKVVERISEFDYSNFKELKKNIKIIKNTNVKFTSIDIFKFFIGKEVKMK